jgi:hypothetical protein
MPAWCSPLNGVTVFGHPAASASAGELNHRPTWNVWTGGLLAHNGLPFFYE